MSQRLITLKFKMFFKILPFIIGLLGFLMIFIKVQGIHYIISNPIALGIIGFVILFLSFFIFGFKRYKVYIYNDRLEIKHKDTIDIKYNDINNITLDSVRRRSNDETYYLRFITLRDVNQNALGKIDLQVLQNTTIRKELFEIILHHNPHIILDEECEVLRNGEYLPLEKVAYNIKNIALIGFTLFISFVFISVYFNIG